MLATTKNSVIALTQKSWTYSQSAAEYLARLPGNDTRPRLLFLLLALLAFTGVLDNLTHALGWNVIFEGANNMLQDSVTASTVMTFILATIKGLLAMVESAEANLFVASVDVGALVQGLAELIDTAFRFFVGTMGIIAAQISFLNIIELTAMKLVVGAGAVFMVIQPQAATLFGRLGRLFLALGAILYFVFPFLIFTVGEAYETQRIEAEINSQESFGVLREKASDLSLSSVASEDGRERIQQTLSSGVNATWQSFLGLVTGYILMFVILPLASLGLSYVLLRQVLNSLEFQGAIQKIERSGKGISDWVRPRGSEYGHKQESMDQTQETPTNG